MTKSYGALLNVYNEETFLPYCLEGIIYDIDELVIIHGGIGLSTDRSLEIIAKYMDLYPDKIKYHEGVFLNPDGTWDETSQVNFGLSYVSTDFVIRIQPDLIFDYGMIKQIKDCIRMFPDSKFFYCFQIDFFIDTNHIRLFNFPLENDLPHPVSVDPVAIAMDSNLRAEHIGEARRFGMRADIDDHHCYQWLADIKKYHFGYVRPFRQTFEKTLNLIRCGNLLPLEEMATLDEEGRYRRALKHVLDFWNTIYYEYCGHYPYVALAIKNLSLNDGAKEFMEWFNSEPWRL